MASYDYSITSLQSHLSMLRKLYGWTMEQFGDRIGVTKQTVSNLERGKPKMTKLQYIAIRSVFESEAKERDGEEKEILPPPLLPVLPPAALRQQRRSRC